MLYYILVKITFKCWKNHALMFWYNIAWPSAYLSPPPIGQIPPQLDMDYNARKAPIGGEFLRLLQLAAWRREKQAAWHLVFLFFCPVVYDTDQWSLLIVISIVWGKPYWIIVPNSCKKLSFLTSILLHLGFILKSVLVCLSYIHVHFVVYPYICWLILLHFIQYSPLSHIF